MIEKLKYFFRWLIASPSPSKRLIVELDKYNDSFFKGLEEGAKDIENLSDEARMYFEQIIKNADSYFEIHRKQIDRNEEVHK